MTEKIKIQTCCERWKIYMDFCVKITYNLSKTTKMGSLPLTGFKSIRTSTVLFTFVSWHLFQSFHLFRSFALLWHHFPERLVDTGYGSILAIRIWIEYEKKAQKQKYGTYAFKCFEGKNYWPIRKEVGWMKVVPVTFGTSPLQLFTGKYYN